MYTILFTSLFISFFSLFSAEKEEKLRKNISSFPRLFMKHKNRKDGFIECAMTSLAAGGITFLTKYYLKKDAKISLKAFTAIMAAGCSSSALVINYLFYRLCGPLQVNKNKLFHLAIHLDSSTKPPINLSNNSPIDLSDFVDVVAVTMPEKEKLAEYRQELSTYKDYFNKELFPTIISSYEPYFPYVYVANINKLSDSDIKKDINQKFSPQGEKKPLYYPIVVLDHQTRFYDSKEKTVKGRAPTQHVYGISFGEYAIGTLSSKKDKKFTKEFIDGMTKASFESIKFWMNNNPEVREKGVSLRQSMVGLGIYLFGLTNPEDHKVVAQYYADALVREINTAHKDGYKIYSVYNVRTQDRNEKPELFSIIQNSFKENPHISLGEDLFDTKGIIFDGPENYIRDEENRVVIFQNPSNNSGPIGNGEGVEGMFCKRQPDDFFNDAPAISCTIWSFGYFLGIIR